MRADPPMYSVLISLSLIAVNKSPRGLLIRPLIKIKQIPTVKKDTHKILTRTKSLGGNQPSKVTAGILKPSVDPRASDLANKPYKIIEKASDNNPKKIALYFASKNPKANANIPDTNALKRRRIRTSLNLKNLQFLQTNHLSKCLLKYLINLDMILRIYII